MYDLDHNVDVNLKDYEIVAKDHEYVEDLSHIDDKDKSKLLDVGVDTSKKDRSGTFIQMDKSVIHCNSCQDGIEILGISQAIKQHEWLDKYIWKNVAPQTDKYTTQAKEVPHEGYFIRSKPGVKSQHPIQSCLYISKDRFAQSVHNIVIAEEGSELHIITGCATSPHLMHGLHVGVSEFYVKKGAKLTFTMIHDWGENVNVRPRTVTTVEEGGVIVSNYVSLRPVGSLQMAPKTYLAGANAVARFNSILVANKGCKLDVGSTVVLDAPKTKAEIISRGISSGGTIIARGNLIGKAPDIKAHLECKGLILNNGLMHAIPELQAHLPGVEMSHEAAVGKIDKREIEYLMARGLNEDEAVSTIVRGFLNVDIEGLPPKLKNKLDQAITKTQEDMF